MQEHGVAGGPREQLCEITKQGISESPRFLNKPYYPNPLWVYFISPVTVLSITQFLIRFGNYSNLSY